MLRKAVIPAAGLGTRLLTTTLELPKEMLPIFTKGANGILVKPMLQAIFEQLYDFGIREFCFIVGRGKRAIEDHFNPDYEFVQYLEQKGKKSLAEELKLFYEKLENSTLFFVNQPEPKGFGDAVLKAKGFTLGEPFIVHAGDDLILSDGNSHFTRMLKVFQDKKADVVLLAERKEDPSRYGVISSIEEEPKVHRIIDIVEKPKKPPTNLCTIAVYIFNNKIYKSIESVKPDESGEIQLTDAIRSLVSEGGVAYAIELTENEKRIDIGVPESYWDALKTTFEKSIGGK